MHCSFYAEIFHVATLTGCSGSKQEDGRKGRAGGALKWPVKEHVKMKLTTNFI